MRSGDSPSFRWRLIMSRVLLGSSSNSSSNSTATPQGQNFTSVETLLGPTAKRGTFNSVHHLRKYERGAKNGYDLGQYLQRYELPSYRHFCAVPYYRKPPPPATFGGILMRVALYARVSTCNGQSPEMQLAELREYVSRRGWEVFSKYVDLGISGSKESRPELNRLMADAHRRNFDVVL